MKGERLVEAQRIKTRSILRRLTRKGRKAGSCKTTDYRKKSEPRETKETFLQVKAMKTVGPKKRKRVLEVRKLSRKKRSPGFWLPKREGGKWLDQKTKREHPY